MTRLTSPACDHFSNVHGVCGLQPATRYLTGYRCGGHTPAQLAGRPEPAPDPDATVAGLRRAARAARTRARVEAEHRAAEPAGWSTTPPLVSPQGWVSRPGRQFTSADVDMSRVRRAQAAVGAQLTRDAQVRAVRAREGAL